MKKRISVDQLRVGMHVAGFEESWLRTPFFTHSFALKREEQIRRIRDQGISRLIIDTARGLDVAEEEDGLPLEGPAPPEAMTGEEVRRYARLKDELFQIDRDALLEGSHIDFTLYVKEGLQVRVLAEYRGRDMEVDAGLLSAGGELLVEKADIPRYKGYLAGIMSRDSGVEGLSGVRNRVLKENTKILVKELLSEPRSGNTIKQCKAAVEEIINAVHDAGGLVNGLLTINKHDYYTYAHSVEVSVLSVGCASALGMDRDRDLFSIGIGSLLHDIGKSEVPTEILNKPGRLSAREFSLMKQHVLKGLSLIDGYDDIPESALLPIIQHHERLSGSGYPYGLGKGDIEVAGRIVAIADVYDAVTTNRTYRRAMSPFRALMLMRQEMDGYDGSVFEVFVRMLGNQPAGLDALR